MRSGVNQYMLYIYITKYQFDMLNQILPSFPINTPITYSEQTALSVACTLPDATIYDKQQNERLMEIILKQCPNVN
jgi:hypothetical protein